MLLTPNLSYNSRSILLVFGIFSRIKTEKIRLSKEKHIANSVSLYFFNGTCNELSAQQAALIRLSYSLVIS